MDTIFALSSGRPPAAIAVVRISGDKAREAGVRLAGWLPPAGEARLRTLRTTAGAVLDRALVVWFARPGTATGEDIVELHLHGGSAVVGAVEAELAARPELRRAEAGEFTRRALLNGRIDLTEAQGLGDLLAAETEAQRRAAMASAGGAVSRAVGDWADRLVTLSAETEALLDMADEDDVASGGSLLQVQAAAAALASDMAAVLAHPTVDRLRDGIRVVLAGPPNSGKSTLLNALVAREAAIVSPMAGTTRDRIEAAVSHSGLPFLVIDTAGLNEAPGDEVERIGIARAEEAIEGADILLWLGDADPPDHPYVITVHPRADLPERRSHPGDRVAVSSSDPASIMELWRHIVGQAAGLVPAADALPLSQVQHEQCAEARYACTIAAHESDPILIAEHLRHARAALAKLTGATHVESVLDALFARFCVGK